MLCMSHFLCPVVQLAEYLACLAKHFIGLEHYIRFAYYFMDVIVSTQLAIYTTSNISWMREVQRKMKTLK